MRGFFWTLFFLFLSASAQEDLKPAVPRASCSPQETLRLDFNSKPSSEEARSSLTEIQSKDTSELSPRCMAVTGYGSLLNVTQLNDALRQLAAPLEEFHFDLNVPLSSKTIEVIQEYHPLCRINYTIPFEYYGYDIPVHQSMRRSHSRTKLMTLFRAAGDPYDPDVPSVQSGVEPAHQQRHALRRSILGSPNLYSLTAKLIYSHEKNYEDLNLVHDILTSCPNVRELDLSFERDGGCVIAEYPYAFDFTKNTKPFPPLEVLKLSGYRFYAPVHGRQPLGMSLSEEFGDSMIGDALRIAENAFDTVKQQWNMLGDATGVIPKLWTGDTPPDNLGAWLERMDWSQIRQLKMDRPSALDLERLGSVLVKLEHLTSSSNSYVDSSDLPSFIHNLTTPLKHLSLSDDPTLNSTDLLSSLRLSSTSLLSLHLRTIYLSATQLHGLAHDNPAITHLTIDVPRNFTNITDHTTWTIDSAAIQAAAHIPHLQALDLFVDSPDEYLIGAGISDDSYRSEYAGVRLHDRFYHDPNFNRTSVPGLFVELNDLRRSRGLDPMERLSITVGLWDLRHSDWGMLGPPTRLVGHWVCARNATSEGASCMGGNERMGEGVVIFPEDGFAEDWTRSEHEQHQGGFDSGM